MVTGSLAPQRLPRDAVALVAAEHVNGRVGALMMSSERAYPLRVIRVVLTERRAPPVYPDKQTSSESVGMSQRCQKRKHWIEQLYFRLASWAVFTVRNGLDHPI